MVSYTTELSMHLATDDAYVWAIGLRSAGSFLQLPQLGLEVVFL